MLSFDHAEHLKYVSQCPEQLSHRLRYPEQGFDQTLCMNGHPSLRENVVCISCIIRQPHDLCNCAFCSQFCLPPNPVQAPLLYILLPLAAGQNPLGILLPRQSSI